MDAAAEVDAQLDAVLAAKAKKAINKAGYDVGEIVRMYPPVDPGGDVVVLFHGESKKLPATARAPHTAYIRDSGERSLQFLEAVVAEGW